MINLIIFAVFSVFSIILAVQDFKTHLVSRWMNIVLIILGATASIMLLTKGIEPQKLFMTMFLIFVSAIGTLLHAQGLGDFLYETATFLLFFGLSANYGIFLILLPVFLLLEAVLLILYRVVTREKIVPFITLLAPGCIFISTVFLILK